jgi:hypothetical protein
MIFLYQSVNSTRFFISDYSNVEIIDTTKFQPEICICLIQLGIDQQKGNKWLIETKNTMRKQNRLRRSMLGSIFEEHVKHEFIDQDVNATMRTMVKQPHSTSCSRLDGRRWISKCV